MRLPMPRARRAVLPRLPSRPLRGVAEPERHAHRTAAWPLPGCMVMSVYPEIGRALIAVLRAAGVKAVLPAKTAAAASRSSCTAMRPAPARWRAPSSPHWTPSAGRRSSPPVPPAARRSSAGPTAARRGPAVGGARGASGGTRARRYGVPRGRRRPAPGAAGARATYHDPCHLARGQGVRSQPRDLITSSRASSSRSSARRRRAAEARLLPPHAS